MGAQYLFVEYMFGAHIVPVAMVSLQFCLYQDWALPKSMDHISLAQLLLQHLGQCQFAKILSKCGE